jgi:hypothetical protein
VKIVTIIKDHKRVVTLLSLTILVFILVEQPYISSPIVGVHSWDESSYDLVASYSLEKNNPFLFITRFDINSPEYNERYIYYWSAFIYLETVNTLGFDAGHDTSPWLRGFSTVATAITFVAIFAMIYLILNNGKKKEEKDYLVPWLAATAFLFSPLVLWFGTKTKIEPFGLMLFVLFMFCILAFIKIGNNKYLWVSAAILGLLSISRAPYLFFSVIYPLMLFLYPGRFRIPHLLKVMVVFAIFFAIPLLISQLAVPQYDPFNFFLTRFFIGGIAQSDATSIQTDLGSSYFFNSYIVTFGLIGIFGLLGLVTTTHPRRKILMLFLIPALLYFALTYQHNIIHMYHSYYFILPIIIAFAFFLDWVRIRIRQRGRISINKAKIMVIALALVLIVPGYFIFTERYGAPDNYTGTGMYLDDSYGNAYDVIAGTLIDKISAPAHLQDGYSVYSSMTCGYYSHNPFIGYEFFYHWNETQKNFDASYDFYANATEFMKQVRALYVPLIIVDPSAGGTLNPGGSKLLWAYVNATMVPLDTIGPYRIFINHDLDTTMISEQWFNNKAALTANDVSLPTPLFNSILGR